MRRVAVGDLVLTARHRGPVQVRGRNGCHPEQLWGWPVVGGKARQDRMCVFLGHEITALETENGFRMVLPGTVG